MFMQICRCFTCQILSLQCTKFHFILYLLKFWSFLSLTHETHTCDFRSYSSFLTTKFSLQESKLHLYVVLHSHKICFRLSYLSVSFSLCLFPMQVVQAVMVLTCILEVSNLNLCPDSCYPSKVLFMNTSISAGGFKFGTSVRARVIDSFQTLYNS
jgi:hypothetical protein